MNLNALFECVARRTHIPPDLEVIGDAKQRYISTAQ